MWTSEVWRTWAKYCRWVVLLPRGLPGQTTSNDGHGTQHILPTVTPKKNGNYNPTLFLAYPASYQMSPLRSGSTVQRTEYHGRSEWVALSGLTSFFPSTFGTLSRPGKGTHTQILSLLPNLRTTCMTDDQIQIWTKERAAPKPPPEKNVEDRALGGKFEQTDVMMPNAEPQPARDLQT